MLWKILQKKEMRNKNNLNRINKIVNLCLNTKIINILVYAVIIRFLRRSLKLCLNL